MPPKNAVEVVITARNEAKGTFDDFGKDVNSATKLMRTMAGDLVSLVNPAFGQFTTQMVHATREAKNMSAGMGVAVVGITALGAALTAAIQSMRAMATLQTELNIAMRQFDAGRVRSEVEGLRKEIETMKTLEESGFLGRLWAGLSKSITGLGGLLGLGQGAPATRLNPARQMYEQAIAPQHALDLAQFAIQIQQQNQQRAAQIGPSQLGAQYGAITETLGLQAQISELQRDLAIARGVGTMGERERQEELHQARLRLFRGGAGLQRETLRLGAAAQYMQLAGTLGQPMPGEEDVDPAEYFARSQALRSQQIQDARRQRDALLAGITAEAETRGESPGAQISPQMLEQMAGTMVKARVNLRDLDRERVEIAASQLGLSKQQEDVLQSQIIEMQRLRDIEAAKDITGAVDPMTERLANLRAEMAQFNLELQRAQRDNPLAGLAKGFEDSVREAGQVMQDFARTTARTMTQTFDDLFFAVFTGRFKDLGRSIANNLLRSVSGALSDLITQPAIRALSGGLRGLSGGLVPTLVAGGTALVPSGSVSAYGGTPGIVAPVGGGVAGGVPGGGIYDSIFQYAGAAGSSIGQFFGFGGGAAAAEFGAATIGGYGGEAAFAGIAGAEGAGVDIFSSGAGAAVGGGLGAAAGTVGAGVGFLASIYAAYQTRSPGYGAATGAVGGLVAGLTIGSIYPGVGTLIGGVVGLIAGGALGAGAGALGGKGGHRSVGAERRSAQAVSEAVTNFSATLNQAESGEDILNILNRQWAPNGELVIYATASDGSERNALRGLGFSYKDLFDPAIVESITVAAGVTGTARPSFELTQALRGRIQQIAGIEAGLLFATTAKGPGVTRTTYEAFAAALQGTPNVGPRNFFFSTDLATNAGASTAQVGSVIRAFLQTNDALDIAPDLTQDRFLSL